MRKIVSLALGLTLLTGCNNADYISIGAILPLTGDYYYCGQEIKKGVDLAIAQQQTLLGKKIKFVVENDDSSHITNIEAYNKLVSDKSIKAVIGGGNSVLSSDIAAVSQKYPLPVIVPSASLKSITAYGNNIFRIGFIDEVQGQSMADFANSDLKSKTAAVIYDSDNDFTVTLAKSFKERFEQNGGKIVSYQSHPYIDNDFKIQLNKIKLSKPDVLFIADYAYNGVLIAKQARDMNIKSNILAPDTFEEAITQTNDWSMLNDIYFCTHYSTDNPDAQIQKFVSAYKDKYKTEPSSFAALGFDSAKVLFDAIERGQSTDMQSIIQSLLITNYNGITGNISFDSNRNPIKDITILKIFDGKNQFYKTISTREGS